MTDLKELCVVSANRWFHPSFWINLFVLLLKVCRLKFIVIINDFFSHQLLLRQKTKRNNLPTDILFIMAQQNFAEDGIDDVIFHIDLSWDENHTRPRWYSIFLLVRSSHEKLYLILLLLLHLVIIIFMWLLNIFTTTILTEHF